MRKPLLFVTALSLLSSLSFAQSISLLAGSTYTQNFDALANTGTTNDQTTLPSGWSMLESGANANTTYAADNGSSNAGNTYSYGTTAATDRALGGLLSGNLTPLFGASFTNNTGITLTSITINYTGELWRLGTASRTDQLDFSLSLDATSLSTGTWSDINNLDFVTPNTATAGTKDGNAAGNRTAISFTITGLSIANGATFWIRWSDFNATNADDGLAVDDFSLSTNASILPVSLSHFAVAREKQTVVANWATTTESNSKQFELQRSSNGSSNWSTVSTVAASGNSNTLRSYKAVDAAPINGTNFYRLKSVDLDGSFTYSAVQQVQFAATTALSVRIYPNPASHTLQVQLGQQAGFNGRIQISNAAGQVLISRQMNSTNGSLAIPIQQLRAGLYTLQVQDAGMTKPTTTNFVVQ